MSARAPLAGRRVLVTRAPAQAGGLVERLRQLGAGVVFVPLIDIRPVASSAALAAALDRLRAHPGPRLAVFSSANAVRLVAAALPPLAARLESVSVAAAGSETAAALRRASVEPAAVPETFVAEALAATLAGRGLEGARAWLPQAAGARPVLAETLSRAGAEVETTVVYRSVLPEGAAEALRSALSGGDVDAVLLTSGSAVEHLVRALGDRPFPPAAIAACIGPVTAGAARRAGLPVGVVAPRATAEALAGALAEHLG